MKEANSEYLESIKNKKPKDDVEYRKIQAILGDVSFTMVLPKSYAVNMGLKKGDFVKVYQQRNRILIEKA